jgi:hypothetical protein
MVTGTNPNTIPESKGSTIKKMLFEFENRKKQNALKNFMKRRVFESFFWKRRVCARN